MRGTRRWNVPAVSTAPVKSGTYTILMNIPTDRLALKALFSGNSRLVTTLGYYATFIILGMVGASVGPFLPKLAEQTGSTLSAISVIFIARSSGFLCSALFGGRLYDRVSGHLLIAGVMAGIALMFVAMPFIPVLWLLTGLMLVFGIAVGLLDVGGNTLIVWVHRQEVAPFMNGLHFFFGFGAFLSPLLIAWTMGRSGRILEVCWILAVLIIPVAAWIMTLPNPQPEHVSEHAQRHGKQPYGLLCLAVLFFFLYDGAEISFGNWIFTYTMLQKLGDQTQAAYLTSAFWGAFTFGRLLSIPCAVRIPPLKMLVGCLTGGLISLSLIVFQPQALPALIVGTCGTGLAMSAVFPTMLSFIGRRVRITGQITGWFFVGASLGAMMVPWVIGQFLETLGPRIVMICILAAFAGACLVFGGLLLYFRRRSVSSALVQ